jgi:hypothetical protein
VAPESHAADPSGDESEDPDPACGHALHERERRECEGGDVEREAGALEREAEEPAAIPQQQCCGVERSSKRERRQGGSRIVLAQVRDVDQCRGRERQQKREWGQGLQLRWQPGVAKLDAVAAHRDAFLQQELALASALRDRSVGADDAVPGEVLVRRREDAADQAGRAWIDVAVRADEPARNRAYARDDP